MYIHPATFKVLHKAPPKIFFRCLNGLKYLDDVEYEEDEVLEEEMPVLWYDELIILEQKDENFRCLHKQKS